MPEEKVVNLGGTIQGFPKTPIVPDVPTGDPLAGKMSVNDMTRSMLSGIKTKGVADIPMSSIYSGSRYTETRPGTDYEEMAGQQQSAWDKWRNASGKMLGIAATSFVSGTAGLVYGIGSAIKNQRLASLIDNDVTRAMDNVSTSLEDVAPNYYTHAEQDAEWYSPKNILTANFWSDKVLKNLGFSLGAMGGGIAWGSLLKGIGLTNALVKAGQGLEAATAVEDAMTAAPKLGKYAAFENALNATAQKYIKNPISAVLKDSDRILTSAMGTFGEASMEGLQGMNEFRKKLIQDYKDKYGVDPQGQDLDEINSYADKVGLNIWAQNTLLLTGTNYVQLPKILASSRKADKALINDIEQEAIGSEFKVVKPETKFGRIAQGVKGIGSLLFAPSEAFEEGMQSSIQTGVKNYFDRAYKNKKEGDSFLSDLYDTMGTTLSEGVDDTLSSKEGLESILIGGISGGLQEMRESIKERGVFGTGGEKRVNTEMALSALNKTNIDKALKDVSNFINIGIGSQKLRQQAVTNNDKLSEKDYEQDFTLSYLMPRVKYGKIDSVNQELDYYKNQAMDDQGFDQLKRGGVVNENETKEQFIGKIENLKKLAKQVDNTYSDLNDKYSGIRNDKGDRVYSDDVIDKMVYAAAKIKNYDERIPGINSSLIEAGLSTQDIINDVIKKGSEDVSSVNTAKSLISAMDIPDVEKDDLNQNLDDLIEASLRRKLFIDQYNDIKKSPDKYKEIVEPEVTTKPGEKKSTIKIKTNKGEKEFNVGEQYYVSKIVKKTKEGEPFYETPIITILGENEDGTIKIKNSEGKIVNINRSKFNDHSLVSLDFVKNNKKAKFFLDNWNTVFEHKGLKDRNGKPRRGRLEYSQKDDILLFKYINDYGKERTVEVRGPQFAAQKGYNTAMISSVEKLTAAQQESFENFVKEKDNIRDSVEKRKQVVINLVNNSRERLNDVTDELAKAKDSLQQVEEALHNAMFTKKGLPRKAINAYKKTINQLSSQKQAIENTISTLQEEKDELESQLPYMESLLQYAETMPEDYKEVIEDLKDDISNIEEMVDNTNDAIKNGESLLSKIDEVLKNALSLMDDFIKRVVEENPNIPLSIDQFKSSIERFLGEEGAKNFIAEKQGFTQAVLDLEDQISLFSDELKIPDMTRKVQRLQSQMSELESGVEDLVRQAIAKGDLLEAFETSVAKFEQELAEQSRLEEDEAFAERIMKTADSSQRTLEEGTEYEEDNKKTNLNIPRATVASQNLPGYAASQAFGNNIESFPNRKSIKAIVVTRKNQADILPGLIEHLGQEKLSEAEMNNTIAIVMVEEQADGSRKLVGTDGKVLENPTFDNAVYQVMPTEELKWSEEYGGKEMFRKGTADEVKKSLKEQYKAWREETLENPPIRTFSIEASFGNPQRVSQKDENGNVITDKNGNPIEDKNAMVSVSEAGLISEDDLENHRILRIPTTNDSESRGTTSFKNAMGRVFLSLKNGLVKLQNRKITEKEANTIHQAIARLSEIMFSEDGDIKSEEAQRLLRWLKSVVYWGTPKDAQGKAKSAGHNSIFFDRVEVIDDNGNKKKSLRLFFSNKDGSIPFTPSYIKDNKSGIIALIQKLYNNVNSTRANGGKKNEWSEPYEEILEVKPNGEIVSRQWENYQTFLLSSKNPDGSARKNEELPLHTTIRPKAGPEDANRQGVYFVLTDLQYKEPIIKETPKTAKKIVPGAKTASTTQLTEAKEGEIDLSGKKINTFVSPAGKKIRWVYDNSKTGLAAIVIIKGGDIKEVVAALTEKLGSEEKARENVKQIVLRSIPAGALEDSETIIIGEDDEEIYDDADTYVEPDPNEKAEDDEEAIIIGDDETDIENQLNEEDEDDEPLLRQIIDEDVTETERWPEIEKWLKANFPNLPVYRVKNILKSTNGLQAWGMLKNGALYVYENAEVGTIYHEVFEGVWKMFSNPKERKAVVKEFTSRKGSFVDRPTGQVIAYKDATNSQVKEQLAEEFRDYVQYGKMPAKPVSTKPFILRLFADIVNAVKNLFANTPGAKNNTERLFAKINKGYYKSYIPFETNLSFAKKGIIDIEDATIDKDSELRLKIPGETVHDIMQQMTYLTLRDIISSNDSLFNVSGKPKAELYRMLRYETGKTILRNAKKARKGMRDGKYNKEQVAPIIEKGIALWKTTMKNWEDIVKKHQEYLRSYNIEFDENDEMNVRSDENTGRGEYDSSDKIDHFRKTNSAIKLLLSTLPIMENDKPQRSSINGIKLLPLSQVYMSLMNNLHTSINVDDMIERIRQMATNDENYRLLYSRLTGTDYSENTVDFSEMLDGHDLQLIIAMWTTFKKQSPDARTIFIFESGEVNMGESNLSSAARQVKSEYETAIATTMRKKNPYFEYSDKEKVFVGKPGGIKSVNLGGDETVVYAKMVEFLKSIGIKFTEKEITSLPTDKKTTFKDAVTGIRDSIKSADQIATIGGKVLDIEGRLLQLALVRASIDNPEFDSTFFNVKGERTQTFMGTNAISDFFDAISQIENLNDLTGTQYEYLLTDEFVQGSVILSKMFNMKTGERKDSPIFMKAGYADGTVNTANGKKKQSSKLNYKERLVQEINMNLNGYYTNLVPGDASLEHTVFMGNAITEQSLLSGFDNVFKIFGGYLESEVKLSRSDRPVIEGRNSKDLRFFKGILGDVLHDKIVKDTKTPIEEIYGTKENPGKYKKEVDAAVEAFIKKDAQRTKSELMEYGIIKFNSEGEIVTQNIAFTDSDGMNEVDLNRKLNALSTNYIISNIELHKLIYSDPYQYADELKRIKNFLSPRQAILHGSAKMNEAMNIVYNRGFERNDIGRTDFNRDYFRTISYNDVLGEDDLPGYEKAMYKETDGAGIINFKSYRNFRIRRGKWSAAEELQFKYDIAWEKRYKGIKLSDYEKEILKDGNPEVRSAYTTEKPIVAGNKADGNSYNDVVLDKYSLYPLSFRVIMELNPKSNAVKLYNKMQKEDIDYIVFDSARKVGAKNSTPLYDTKGNLNPAPYSKDAITNIPFAIMSVQAEVPSKEDEIVTRGSQVTKLVTMDFMEAGVPVDFEEGLDFNDKYIKWIKLSEEEKLAYNNGDNLYKEIKNNQMLLEAMIDNGYNTLLNKMGIEEIVKDGKVTGYEVTDFSKAAETLREEILKRESNDNISDALSDFISGNAVLEATPAYQQVRNILYSIADKNVVSPKITGGMKVQIPSTLLESVRAEATVIETKKGPKTVYTSKELSFYKDEDGKRVCEIMVGRWFKSEMTDAELIKYFNSEEGRKILSGIGFRIPTQKQNSIDAFVIKRFLPAEFGDNVIVPAQLVQKQGSDFDIDKLSLYFKNLFTDNKGNLKLVPYLGIGKEALAKFEDMFYDMLQERIEKAEGGKEKLSGLKEIIGSIIDKTASKKTKNKWIPILRDMFGEDLTLNELEDTIEEKIEKAIGKIQDLSDQNIQDKFMDRFKETMYKKSLENAYVESLEKLVTHPKNFDQLIKPNSADDLKDLSAEITELRGIESFDYSSTKNMLSRVFMTRLRYAFVTGKYAIGIAAVNQTNHSLNQRQPMFVDIDRLEDLSSDDQAWLGDGKIKFEKYNSMNIKGKNVPILSMIKNSAGEFISDLIGQFIDGYVDIAKGPWIMELGAWPNVASTWLFLIKLGVPMKSVGYFMNQPIIRDYLNRVENAGYSWLFIDTFVKDTLKDYASDVTASDKIPSEAKLREMIGNKKLDKQQLAQQRVILQEFLKYSKMASHMFLVTQGSNFDTATFNDPMLIFKKNKQLEKAQNTIISSLDEDNNIVPGVDAILKNSFLGKLAYKINNVRDAYAEFLSSDKGKVRSVIENVLTPYIDLPDREFVKVARKAVSDLFDWAVQTDPSKKLNMAIADILLKDGGAAEELQELFDSIKSNKKHPLKNNYVIQTLIHEVNGEVNNMKLKNRDNKVYDQNQVIYAFAEIKNYLNGENNLDVYKRLVAMSILQSGVSTSPISFTQLLPYEDFKEEYNKILAKLNTISNLEDFYNLGVFQRNNWNNDDLVPYSRAGVATVPDYIYGTRKVYNPAMEFLPKGVKEAVTNGTIPRVVTFSTLSSESRSEYVVYSWEKSEEELLTKKEMELPSGKRAKLLREKKTEMKKKGDFSYIQKGLFQRVKESDEQNADPLIHSYTNSKGELKQYYVYKMINAWGNSFSANEFYATGRSSVIDNRFLKAKEVSDAPVINAFLQKATKTTVTRKGSTVTKTIYTAPITQAGNEISPKGTIQLELIEDLVQKGKAKTTIRNYDKVSGIYTSTKTGKPYDIVNRGKVKMVGKKIVGDNVSYTLDEFGAAEGFNNWAGFVKAAKYAGIDLQKGKEVYLYDIKPAQTAGEIKPKGKPAIKDRNQNNCG